MSNKPGIEIKTPVGRLVRGDCFKANDKDHQGKLLTVKNGPNAGQPTVNYYIGVAIDKNDVSYNDLYATIYNEARVTFPSLFDANGNCLKPDFAFKITDGDSQVPDTKNNKPCDRVGFPGHWILNFSNGFAPKCYKHENGAWLAITDHNEIKRGYYAQVAGTVKGNDDLTKPGVYLNHTMILLVAKGEEIIGGRDPGDVFGDTPPQLPAGATPLNATPPPPAQQPPGQGPSAPPPPGQGPSAPPPPPPPSPAPDYLQVEKKYLHDGKQWTAEQLLSAGWPQQQIDSLPTTN